MPWCTVVIMTTNEADQITDAMVEAFGQAWMDTEPGEPGARRRAGLKAALAVSPIATQVRAILDSYNQIHDDEDDFEECEPEDRWRLFRDLREIVGGGPNAKAPKTCPRCGGSGEVLHPNSEHLHPNDPAVETVDCPECFGQGVLR